MLHRWTSGSIFEYHPPYSKKAHRTCSRGRTAPQHARYSGSSSGTGSQRLEGGKIGDFKSEFAFLLSDADIPATPEKELFSKFGPLIGDAGQAGRLFQFSSYSYDHLAFWGSLHVWFGLKPFNDSYETSLSESCVCHIPANHVGYCIGVLENLQGCVSENPEKIAKRLTYEVRRWSAQASTPTHPKSRVTYERRLKFAISAEEIAFLWECAEPRGCLPDEYGKANAYLAERGNFYGTSAHSNIYQTFNYLKTVPKWLSQAKHNGMGMVFIYW